MERHGVERGGLGNGDGEGEGKGRGVPARVAYDPGLLTLRRFEAQVTPSEDWAYNSKPLGHTRVGGKGAHVGCRSPPRRLLS